MRLSLSDRLVWIVLGCGFFVVGAGLAFLYLQQSPEKHTLPQSSAPLTTGTSRPPWIYGNRAARFTIVAYTDFECVHCREYFPSLRLWVDAHPEANLQWHHLPLSPNEPASTQRARLAECAGEAGGNTAFWSKVAWIFENTKGDGSGLPGSAQFTGLPPAIAECMRSTRPDVLIQADVAAAARQGIAGTPTLELVDRQTAKTLILRGGTDGDALLSAMDLLAATDSPAEPAAPTDN